MSLRKKILFIFVLLLTIFSIKSFFVTKDKIWQDPKTQLAGRWVLYSISEKEKSSIFWNNGYSLYYNGYDLLKPDRVKRPFIFFDFGNNLLKISGDCGNTIAKIILNDNRTFSFIDKAGTLSTLKCETKLTYLSDYLKSNLLSGAVLNLNEQSEEKETNSSFLRINSKYPKPNAYIFKKAIKLI